MKKWIISALIVCIAGVVQAGEGEEKKKDAGSGKGKEVTKEQFVASQKKNAEKKGIEFDQATAEAKFDKKDKNKDGKLSAGEKSSSNKKAKETAPATE